MFPLNKSIGLHPCFQLFVCKGLLLLFPAICLQRTIALVSCYLFANNCCCHMFAKDCGPYVLLFTHKRLRFMFTRFICKEIAVLVCAFLAKGCSPYFCAITLQKLITVLVFAIHLQRTMVLVFCCSSAKDYGPCLLLFIYKGLQSLSFAIHLQRTVSSSLAIHLQRTVALSFAIHLQRTVVLAFCHSSAKDCGPCLLLFICKGRGHCLCYSSAKDCGPCLLPFICKGLRSLSFAIHLQRPVVLVFCYSSAKDCVLVSCYSSAKDCGTCLCYSSACLSTICLDGVSSLFLPFVPIFPFDSKEYCPCYC